MADVFEAATRRYHALVKFFRPNERLQMTMFGPSGVGKTSLLASVYDQFKHTVIGTNLDIVPELDEATQLNGHVQALKRLFAKNDLLVDDSVGIRSTAAPRAYRFALGVKGRRPAVNLLLYDIPGGWLSERARPGEVANARRALAESNAVMIPVDTPALMSREGRWHDAINQPGQVHVMFQNAYTGLTSPRLVVLAPMRCERYLDDGADAERAGDLLSAVKDGYKRLLDFLGSEALRDLVVVAVAPVQTLGGIQLHKMHRDVYKPAFRKKSEDAFYKPVDSEQPLRYLLAFALRMYRVGNSGGYFRLIKQLFNDDRDLVAAAEAFATDMKRDNPFAVLQGNEWLSMQGRDSGRVSQQSW
jgi:hypothetical protein